MGHVNFTVVFTSLVLNLYKPISLLYTRPHIFLNCYSLKILELVEGTARIIEARLKREVAEGKIVEFWRTDKGYEVIRLEALNGRENKVCWDSKSSIPFTHLFSIYSYRVSTALWPVQCKLSRV